MSLKFSASPTGTRNTFDRTVDFVADYGAVSGGSAATNRAALDAFNTAYAGFTGHTRLTIPAGTYATTADSWWGRLGGDKLTIAAPGVTLTGFSGFAKLAIPEDVNKQAFISTVSAGASTVSLLTAAETSRFTVGKYVLVSCIEMQGYGDPPNFALFEFKQVESIGTGTLTFTEPLINTYKSTYPLSVDLTLGGPGLVYAMDDAWDQEVELQGAYITDNSNLFYGKTRVAKYTDCTFETYGPCPTANILFRSLRCTGAGVGGLEVDKCAHRVEFIDSMHRAVDFQSASINELYVENMTQSPNARWRGGASKSNTFINLNTTDFLFGPMNYGAQGPTTMTNCTATNGSWFSSNIFPFVDYTEEGGGVLSYLDNPCPPSNLFGYWAVPGSYCVLLDNSLAFAQSFQVTDVSFSGGRTYVSTTLPYPLPGTINGKSPPWKIANHPCADLTMVNCSGNSLFTTQSALPAHTPFQEWTL